MGGKLNAGRVAEKVFGIIWTLFSSVFVIAGLWMAWSSWQDRQWEEVPCEVSEFKIRVIKKNDKPFTPVSTYHYEWKGKEYKGSKVLQSEKATDEYKDLAKIEHLYNKKKLDVCYVNANNPEEASLEKDTSRGVLFGIAFATFGMMFVLIGLGIILYGGKKKRSLSEQVEEDTGLIQKIGSFTIGFIFCGAFALGGIAVLYSGFKHKLVQHDSEDWYESEATVIWSRVVENSDSDGSSYRPEVFYRYTYNGAAYRMNDEIGSGVSSSDYESEKKLADQYRKGNKITCLIDTKKPWESKLKQEAKVSWFLVLFSLPFLLVGFVGIGVLLYSLLGKKMGKGIGTSKLVNEKSRAHTELNAPLVEEVVLKAKRSRLLVLGGALFLALFWNGIVSVFVSVVIGDYIKGSFDLFLTLFLIPFVLIGIILIGVAFYKFLGLFSPSINLTLAPGYIALGAKTRVKWEITSGAQRMQNLEVKLIGEEEATYKRGTSTVTDKARFFEKVILTKEKLHAREKGVSDLIIPTVGNIASWGTENNAIVWKIVVTGKVRSMPDVKDEYEVFVITRNTEETV